MLPLGVSVVDALLVVGLGAAGFVVVALVCVAVLAMLHLVLPAVDSGAAELDDQAASAAGTTDPEPQRPDGEVDA